MAIFALISLVSMMGATGTLPEGLPQFSVSSATGTITAWKAIVGQVREIMGFVGRILRIVNDWMYDLIGINLMHVVKWFAEFTVKVLEFLIRILEKAIVRLE